MASGSVCVRPAGCRRTSTSRRTRPARAPRPSPPPRPGRGGRAAARRGRTARAGDAPSVRATASRRGIDGRRRRPCAASTKNGAATNICAMTTAAVGERACRSRRRGDRRRTARGVRTPAASAMPATAGGMTIGSRQSALTTPAKRDSVLASQKASGVPSATMRANVSAVVRRLSSRAAPTIGWRSPAQSAPGPVVTKSAVTGRTRNRSSAAPAIPPTRGKDPRPRAGGVRSSAPSGAVTASPRARRAA